MVGLGSEHIIRAKASGVFVVYRHPIVHQTCRLTHLSLHLTFWLVNIFDGIMRTGQYAFFATFAIFLPDHTNMSMRTYFKLSQHLIRTSIQTTPTSIAITCSNMYIFCYRMTMKRIVEFHFPVSQGRKMQRLFLTTSAYFIGLLFLFQIKVPRARRVPMDEGISKVRRVPLRDG